MYVFGEDSYRDHGIRRWDAYYSSHGGIHALYVASVAACAILAAVLIVAGARMRPALARLAGSGGGIAVGALTTVTFIGYTAN